MAKVLSTSNSRVKPTAVLIAAGLFVMLEICTRLFFTPLHVPRETYTRYYPKYDYGYSKTDALFFQQNNRLRLYSTEYLDFWPDEIPAEKSSGTFRIFTIGSSVSRGDYEQNYSDYLEQYLNAAASGENFEVINCSATGIGSSRIRLLFEKALEYEPDLIVFHLHGSNEFEDERDLKEAVRLKSSYEGVIRKSRFFCLLKKYMDKNIFVRMVEKDEAIPEETYQRWFVDGKRAEWRRTLAENTAAIVRVANEKNLPIILMNRVVRADSLPGYADDETRDFNAINAGIAGANVLVVDTPALFEKHFGLNADKARSSSGSISLSGSVFAGRLCRRRGRRSPSKPATGQGLHPRIPAVSDTCNTYATYRARLEGCVP